MSAYGFKKNEKEEAAVEAPTTDELLLRILLQLMLLNKNFQETFPTINDIDSVEDL